MLSIVRLARRNRVSPTIDDARPIIRMYEHSPIVQLLERLAEILQDLMVDEFHPARRRHRMNHRAVSFVMVHASVLASRDVRTE